MKGAEDLGGGYKAIFQLENGFDLDTGRLGQGGRMFGRQAYVGVSNDKFGRITLGRQYDSVVDYLAQTTSNGQLVRAPVLASASTARSVRKPDMAGFQFGGTYSFSNDTNFADNRQNSFGAQYTTGGLLFAAVYLQADNTGATSGGAIATNSHSACTCSARA